MDPDDPKDHGRIPAKVRCAFCGDLLPRVGRHAYAFDVGEVTPPSRFWAHAECMLDAMNAEVRAVL